MKQLSFSSSVGIAAAAGLVVAGAVLAFTAPTGAPPTNNAETPLNVSDIAQIKGGGLWVNGNNVNTVGLRTEGYMQLDWYASAPSDNPDCDETDEYGRMAFYSVSGVDRLYVCTSGGWNFIAL